MIGKLYTTPVTDSLGIQYRCLYYGTFGGMCSPFCATFGEEYNLIFSYRILIYPFDVGLGGGYVAFVKPFEVISDPPPLKKKEKKMLSGNFTARPSLNATPLLPRHQHSRLISIPLPHTLCSIWNPVPPMVILSSPPVSRHHHIVTSCFTVFFICVCHS